MVWALWAMAHERKGRWEEAARAYQALSSLHTSTAALFINRIRLGAAALMIASVSILAAGLIEPALAIQDLTLAQSISSRTNLASQLLFMVALALYSCSTISIYKLLSYTRDHRPAFWAMVLSVIGVGLSMPALGIKSFVYPLIGEMMLAGETDLAAIYFLMGRASRRSRRQGSRSPP